MTPCPKGDHEIPDEDEIGAHCAEHGVTLLWYGPPITPDDLAPAPRSRTPAPAPTTGLPAIEQRPRP
ncbi:hypothetical protein [Streptomyces enissocaesilis]|uniref:Uncharacterized protein n=1 Tax=Streptomyces enissocaesilis TaxID=332589 RepID=A0ABP6K316_9ACTN